MGWMTLHRPAGTSDRDFFTEALGENYEIVECASRNRSEFYAAVRIKKTGDVFAYVVMLSWWPNSYENFGYKDMDESMGPNQDHCPRKVLDCLTPLEKLHPWDGEGREPYAYDWRRRCEANLAQAAKARKVKRGDTVTFGQPIGFSNGRQLDTFEFVERNTFRADGTRYRISGWRGMSFTHTRKAVAR